MKNPIALLLLSFLLTQDFSLLAQETPKQITIGYETELESKVLSETRPLLIHLPDGYKESDKSYPVIYLLDGRGHFHHTTGTMQFLARSNRMPEMIIVGIPNTSDRTRDLTPPITGEKKQIANGGGADNMLEFMASELIPFINKNYRTTPYKLLIGHSFGGLFAVHAMVHRPKLFDAHLAISPSMWWDDQSLVNQAETFLEKNPEHQTKLYMTMGNERGTMLGGAWKLAALLEEKTNADHFKWEFHILKEEDHGSVVHRSTYNGLEALFNDWRLEDPFALYQQGGLAAIQDHFEKIKETYGVDGRAPEGMINGLGYRLLNSGKVDEAIEVFAQNVNDYPKSFNVYDSLGEGYKVKGEKGKAIKYYKKSMELNPGNTNGITMLAELGVEYKKEAVKVAPKILESYVGKYEIQPGMMVTITVEDGKLYGEPSDRPKVELTPMAENEFFLDGDNVKVIFNREGKKKAESMTVFMGQEELVGKRIK